MRRFTADASHELRTPIAIIRTTAELALRRERTQDAYRQALDSIHREAEWMTRLAEDLLLLARSDSGTLTMRSEPVDSNDLVRDVARESASIAEMRGIAIEVQTGAGALVQGDRGAWHRLLAILLDNALEHTPTGGVIRIETSASGMVVKNSGPGIKAEDLPHIFERFYRGDPARTRQNGAGLGLAIAQSLAQTQGAGIQAESVEGEGAVFRVTFRTAADQAECQP
jgi:signal transduction histidine kinase